MTIIVQDELRRLRQRDPNAIEDATSHRQGIHASIAADVSKVFQNKSVAELHKLQVSIEAKLAGPTVGLDVGYWESLLSQLKGTSPPPTRGGWSVLARSGSFRAARTYRC